MNLKKKTILNKIYRIEEKDLTKALDQIDLFKTKMELFTGKYPRFSYSVEVNKEDDGWLILLNIKTDNETKETQTS